MTLARHGAAVTADDGGAMFDLARRLFPICRSITGKGVRDTLRILGERIPLTIHEVPTGTKVFDWAVPKEWNIRDAYIKDASGRRIVDFQANNLHVVSYSAPVRQTMERSEIDRHLHSLPERPWAIPYRTSYYDEGWGFCLAHETRQRLAPGRYEVCIDSTLAAGSLSYGEWLLPGASAEEVLIYTHTCHPSLANDNVAGIVVAASLASRLMQGSHRYSYRFVFGPGTIGSLVWMSRNQDALSHVRHGLVAVLLGDAGALRYKPTRNGDVEIDRAARHVLTRNGMEGQLEPFSPYGYDERQFAAPGFALPVGRLSRSANEGYPEYHTSDDNLALLRPESLAGSLAALLAILGVLEGNARYTNTSPFGEPQLGRRGLYRAVGGAASPAREMAMRWTLMFSDGRHSLLDIAARANLDFDMVRAAADDLKAAGLLAGVDPP